MPHTPSPAAMRAAGTHPRLGPNTLARQVSADLSACDVAAAVRAVLALRQSRRDRRELDKRAVIRGGPEAIRARAEVRYAHELASLTRAMHRCSPDYSGTVFARASIWDHPGIVGHSCKGDRYPGGAWGRKTDCTWSATVRVRLLRAIRAGLPASADGVVHLDAQPVDGGWRVTCASLRKGPKVTRTEQYIVRSVDGWVHGDTIEEARATAERRAEELGYSRVHRIALRIVGRGAPPAAWCDRMVTRAHAVAAGLCRVGTDAWLGRHGHSGAVDALPLRIVARYGQRDQSWLVANAIARALQESTT